MFTVCPKCDLMLVITAADLRAAQGHVRCGRCRSVFNALESLCETEPEASSASRTSPAHAQEDAHADASEETESASDAVPAEVSPPAPQPEAFDPQPTEEVWFEPTPAAEADAADTPAPSQSEWADEAPIPAHVGAVPPSVEPAPQHPLETPPSPPSGSEDLELVPARERRSRIWLVGALVLALVLGGQLIDHYRGVLATMPSVGPDVRDFYGALGIPIVPLWNVHAYEARQLGATVSARHPRQITVRASIANRGPWPLPLPLLRVMLQDRYGRTIAARDVRPRDYLSHSPPPAAMLPAGGRIDARVTFVNPGPRAIGFEIDACLREGANVLCAHGPH